MYAGYGAYEKALIDDAMEAYGGYASNIYIVEGMSDTGVAQVRTAVERHVLAMGRAPVVVVDYLQILAPHNERAGDKQNTDRAVTELKRISRDFKTPVVAISSFNRSNYREAATMEAFKESGAVEYTSDVLIALQFQGAGKDGFDANAEKGRNPRRVELVILKNRNGRTGDRIAYSYYPMFNYFEEE
jgi:replicative DNA helicase